MSASSVSLSDYEISTYGTVSDPKCDLGSDPGKPVNIYVNNVPTASTAGGEVSNYTVTESAGRNGQVQYSYNADADTISLPDVEVFEIHDYSADTPAPLHVTNCYSEQTGNYNDADLMYAIAE